jgi:hypothetical protein
MISGLRYDPLPALLACGNPAVEYFTRRDLLGERTGPVKQLWDLPAAQKILRRQQEDGAWKYPGGQERIRSRQDYNQYETFRQLGFLVEQYGLDRKHEAVTQAAEFLLSFQTPGGDFRGIYGNQYTPNYSAAIMELLIKAGYARDPRVDKGFAWLLSARQDDGGWAIPLRTRGRNLDVISMRAAPLEPDPARPFSWLATGVVLRAFAAHPRKRRSVAARQAGELLLSSLFKKDNYPDRGSPAYWLRFTFPFCYTDLISALDSLSLLGFPGDRPEMARALAWFRDNQAPEGLWGLKMLKNKDRDPHFWLALSICRVFKRLY